MTAGKVLSRSAWNTRADARMVVRLTPQAYSIPSPLRGLPVPASWRVNSRPAVRIACPLLSYFHVCTLLRSRR